MSLVRGDATALPLRDGSVDLIVTSPPYFGLRSYRDGGEHLDGQIGAEPTAQEFLAALWAVTAECWRVLAPRGVMFVNLGDKRAATHQGVTGSTSERADRREARAKTRRESGLGGFRAKSRMGLPERYVIGCMDGLADPDGAGWIYRQLMPWHKPSGMPESVTDRTRDDFEHWFMLVKQGDYYSAVDEIREPAATASRPGTRSSYRPGSTSSMGADGEHSRKSDAGLPLNPLGRLPGSVWSVSTEPLVTPEFMVARTGGDMAPMFLSDPWPWARHEGVLSSPWPRPADDTPGPFLFRAPEHFAAFPTEWPRRLILGWSPPGICTGCGEGRFPVSSKQAVGAGTGPRRRHVPGMNDPDRVDARRDVQTSIAGYACACTPRVSRRGQRGDWRDGRDESADLGTEGGWSTPGAAVPRRPGGFGDRTPSPDEPLWEYDLGVELPPTRPAVVLDPFGGTGTTALVARALGRVGISLDLSADYCRLARWRIHHSGHGTKAVRRTDADRQGVLL